MSDSPWTPSASDTYTMTDLEQVKVLADALRVRILEEFCLKEQTTKQVAEALGEKPTRLYHHVDALERVGLIRLVDTKQVRGTVEKYYKAVARAFRADPKLFQPDSELADNSPLVEAVDTVMNNTKQDLQRLIESGGDLSGEDEALVSYVEIRGTEDDVREIREKVAGVLQDLQQRGAEEDEVPEDARRFRLTLAFFPLDR